MNENMKTRETAASEHKKGEIMRLAMSMTSEQRKLFISLLENSITSFPCCEQRQEGRQLQLR